MSMINHGSNFQQQGQLDWVALSKSTVQISLGVLARLSRAGVDYLTINVGQAVCHSFAVQSAGQELVNSSISKLRSFAGYGNLMWFGFGMKSIPEEMAQTEEGLALCALCASLSITYDNLYVAKVLRELCIVSKAPEQLTPSLQQWRSLVDIMAGVFLNSDFALVVNTFQQIIRPSCSSTHSGTRYPPGPVFELAKAILVVGQVSKGRLFSTTFTGGIHCAWLAAFAERVLSLKIEISNANECIYRSSNNAGTVQVFFIIHHLGVEPSSPNLMITSKSYKLTSGRDILANGQVNSDFDKNCLVMRSTWSNILHDTFTGNFEKLSNIPDNPLGIYLTCLSETAWMRRLEDERSLNSPFPNQPWHKENSVGRRFLGYARKRLPELEKTLQSCHEYIMDKPLDHGKNAYGQLRGKCECISHQNYQSRRNETYPQGKSDICLCILADVIVIFLLINMVSSVDEAVLPSISGLGNLYTWYKHYLKGVRYAGQNDFGLLLSFPWEQYPVPSLALTHEVFSGSSPGKISTYEYPAMDSTLAKAGGGLCVYRRFLEDPSLSTILQAQVRVITGYISYECSQYMEVIDSRPQGHVLAGFEEHQLWKHINVSPIIEEMNDFKRLGFSYLVSEGVSITSMSLSFADTQSHIRNRIIHDHPRSRSPQHEQMLGSTTISVQSRYWCFNVVFKTEEAGAIQGRLLSFSESHPDLWTAAIWNFWLDFRFHPSNFHNFRTRVFCGYPLPLNILLSKTNRYSGLIPLVTCILCNIRNIFHINEFFSDEFRHVIPESGISGIFQFNLPDGDTLELPWKAEYGVPDLEYSCPGLTASEI